MYYEIDPGNPRAHGLAHNPFKSLIVPRPIGWISTVSATGAVNLAPYSFFNAVGENPPMVMVCNNGSHAEGGAKDTLSNIRATGEFVVNIVNWDLREAMNKTSAPVPRSVDEMALAGLAPAPSRRVKPPRVAAAPANLECKLIQIVELPSHIAGHTNTAIFGEVVAVHISDAVITNGTVDITKLRPIARLGGMDYAVVDTVFTMQRPR